MSTLPARRRRRIGRLSSPEWWVPMGLRAQAADVGPHRIHWVEAGAGEETVVLLHGLSGSSRWWQRNIPALAAARRVVIPDVIGFGRSRAPGRLPAVPALADSFAEWIATLGAECVHLVGHSMGGQLSIHLAARHPERIRRLVLVDAAGIPRERTPRNLVRFAYEAAPPGRWGDPRFLPVIWRDALVAGPLTVLRGLRHVLMDDVRPLLSRIAAPTLLVWGQRDGLVPLEHGRLMRQTIPGSRLLVIARAYHNCMVDQPETFNAALLRFLDGEEVGE